MSANTPQYAKVSQACDSCQYLSITEALSDLATLDLPYGDTDPTTTFVSLEMLFNLLKMRTWSLL